MTTTTQNLPAPTLREAAQAALPVLELVAQYRSYNGDAWPAEQVAPIVASLRAAIAAQPAPDAVPLQLWCETCDGAGKVYQEHQAGCHVGGEFPCPDCDGKGYITSTRFALAGAAPVAKVAEPVLQDIEQYRMQMAGISTAALGYWTEADGIHPDYDTVPLRDVAKLYAKYAALHAAAHPQHPAPQPLTDEQLERHTLSARDCPPDSQVMLVSTISRLRGISAAQVAPAAGRRHLTLASPELADDMARLKARIASEPGFALSLLVQAGIATVDGQLAPEYGGPAPTTREG